MPENTFLCPIYELSENNPSKTAVLDAKTSIDYHQFHSDIQSYQKGLVANGANKGDVIVISSLFNYDYLCLFFACLRQGLVVFSLNYKWPTDYLVEQLSCYVSCQTRSSFIFVSNTQFNYDCLDEYDCSCFDLLSLKQTSSKSMPDDLSVSYEKTQLSTYLFTSGTTGAPKIATHLFNHHYSSAMVSNKALNFEDNDSWFHCLPVFHVSGISILFRVFFGKGSLYLGKIDELCEDDTKVFSHISCVLTQFNQLKESSFSGFSRLKCILLGGSLIPNAIKQYCSDNKLPVYATYGLTEFSSQVGVRHISTQETYQFLPHVQYSVSEDSTLLIKGDSLFYGYLTKDSVNFKSNSGSFYDTLDVVDVMSDNSFNVLGRLDSMFVSGGENVHPEEIEQVVLQCPAVSNAKVISIPDERFGKVPVLFVSMNRFSESTIRDYLISKLPAYKCPKIVCDLEVVCEELGDFKVSVLLLENYLLNRSRCS